MDWGVKHRMFAAKQSDSVGGGVVFDIRCTSVTAGTNWASRAATGVAPCGVGIVLWTLGRTTAEMTRHVIAAMDNQTPVFMGTSSREFKIGPPRADDILHPKAPDGRGVVAQERLLARR